MAILHDLSAQGHTIIMVTHDPKLAAQAERVIELKDGHVIADYQTEHYKHTDKKNQNLSLASIEKVPLVVLLIDCLKLSKCLCLPCARIRCVLY